MSLNHHAGRMSGRDPHEAHRAATPLELLFDLTFVVAFSQVSTQTAHYLEIGDLTTAFGGFAFTIFGATWAWINYSWLASAYDNDDVFFRLATLVEMIGVIVFALGVPPAFHSIAEGEHLDNALIIAGYVVMRIAGVALWLRAARHDPAHRATCLAYAKNIVIAQVLWIALVIIDLPIGPTFAIAGVLILFELAGPFWAETRHGRTPWHAHHIAERYGLLVIIALGEVVLGTILTISAGVEQYGWTMETVLLTAGAATLAFALWWTYFSIPFGELLEAHRERAFLFGYLHYFVFAAIVGIGAGLHTGAQVIAHDAHVDAVFAVSAVAVPVVLYEFVIFLLYALLVGRLDPFHVWLFAGAVAMLAVAIGSVALGASLGAGLVILACSPVVIVVGYETVGWRHGRDLLARATADRSH
ncbi:low temperature requirement protein A [Microbacterium fluvii]|uniref:Low temperature requirement protein A n=1 Tax=Microbacterium fluvii TaxID=415215 RepID=A0ABW2HEQ6_9MICO|nr:low temperature requirement protein A [Microbacterium fluvii]MCU4671575.1 low temperature requirement protein A [Microbacterium fluvii]